MSIMKVLYDHQAFTYQKWGGVSKSFCELIRNRPIGMDYQISIVESDNTHLLQSHLVDEIKPISRSLASFHRMHSFLGREKIYNFLSNYGFLHTSEAVNKKESIRLLNDSKFDVFHPTFFDSYFIPHLKRKPFVLTVHDLMPEIFGWYKGDPQIKNKPVLCERAAAIVTVSENTKKDLCNIYHIPPEKVHVVYHGFTQENDSIIKEDIIGCPYFLYVGRRGGYKNWERTVKDFAIFRQNHPEVKMVFTGNHFTKREQQIIDDLDLTGAVNSFFATEEQLACLYCHAIAFVFPSLYEGFGMPILEAFSNGCPTLLNNKSCFPEIGGNAAIYFDSTEEHSDLPIKMEDVYSMTKEERSAQKDLMKKQLTNFSWNKSASILFDIYKSL